MTSQKNVDEDIAKLEELSKALKKSSRISDWIMYGVAGAAFLIAIMIIYTTLKILRVL